VFPITSTESKKVG